MNEILVVQKDKIVCPSHLVEDMQCTVHIVCEKKTLMQCPFNWPYEHAYVFTHKVFYANEKY
jgi:hypothetical protein